MEFTEQFYGNLMQYLVNAIFIRISKSVLFIFHNVN